MVSLPVGTAWYIPGVRRGGGAGISARAQLCQQQQYTSRTGGFTPTGRTTRNPPLPSLTPSLTPPLPILTISSHECPCPTRGEVGK
jgi:hypothetical protein